MCAKEIFMDLKQIHQQYYYYIINEHLLFLLHRRLDLVSIFFCSLQTLMIRDWWMCMIISVMFEFLEYSLEHQLPNFSECWWDHVRTMTSAAAAHKLSMFTRRV